MLDTPVSWQVSSSAVYASCDSYALEFLCRSIMVRKTSSMYLVLVNIPLFARFEVRMVGVGDGGALGVEGGRKFGRVADNGNDSLCGIGAGVEDGEVGTPSEETFTGIERVVSMGLFDGTPVGVKVVFGGMPVGVKVERMRA